MDSTVGLVLFLAVLSTVESRLTNVTFTNSRGEFVLQSPNWPHNAPPTSNQIWELTSPPGSKVVLTCPDIRLLKRMGCSEGSLTIWDGLTQMNLCSVVAQYQRESVRNKMFVQFRSGWFGVGRFRCVARVRQMNAMDNFGEPDSREHGQGVGARQTSCPCGWTNKQRIVNGKETGINEYIFPVNIKFPKDIQGFCGGSIITRRHILTAAHCIHGLTDRQMQVVIGEHDFRTTTETNATQIINVQQMIMHENYNHNEMTHDIAILVLARDITFSQLVGPICLPSENMDLLNKYVKVLGWGKTTTNGNFSSYLQKVNLKVVELERCASRYSNFIDTKEPKQLCTFARNKDSCQGDSGGPLVYHDPELSRYVQVALVSYGKDCASDDPAVNIYLPAYFDWIQKTVSGFRPQMNTCEKI